MISRAQRTPFGEWWWTVDRLTLAAIGALMLAGIVLSLAASPPVAGRLGLDPFFFVDRHILYLIPTIAIMLGVSFLNPQQIRRLSLDRVHRQPRAGGSNAVFRSGDQGRAALAGHPRRQYPALGILEARLRHSHRLAVRRIGEAPGYAGQRVFAGAAVARRGAAGDAAGLRPDHAGGAGVERAVLHGRHAAVLGVRAHRPRRGRA